MIGPILALGGLLLWAVGRGRAKDGGGGGGGVDPGPDATIADRVAAALASGSADRMEALATEISGSHPEAAADLRAEAMRIRAASKGKTPGGKTPGGKTPGGKTPGGNGGGEPIVEDPIRVRAQRLTEYLRGIGGLAAKYKEDRSRVLAFQGEEGLTTDGMYGPGSATRILSHGVVPVAPFYWSKRGGAPAQLKAFQGLIATARSGDPQRADQYDELLRDTLRSYRGPGEAGQGSRQPSKGTDAWKAKKKMADDLRASGWTRTADELDRQLAAR